MAISQDDAATTSKPTNFVLVHGAWHDGWCWRRVADLLTAHGHRVFTPTLTVKRLMSRWTAWRNCAPIMAPSGR
jgi:hypothetical protein